MTRGTRAAVVVLAGALGGLGLGLSASLGQPVVLRCGPADHDYTAGFQKERERGSSRRWAKAEASILLPFRIRTASRAIVEAARPGLEASPIEMGQDQAPPTVFQVGPASGAHPLALLPADSVRLSLRASAGDGNRSLQLARVTLLPGAPAAVVPEAALLVRAALSAALLAAALLFVGFSGRVSFLLSAGLVAVPLSLVALRDPLAAVHLARKSMLFLPLLAAAAALLPRERARRYLPVLAVALVARAVVFHPSYDYQDVDIHHQVARVSVREGPAELWRRMPHYQQVFDLGRARAGSGYLPFPYPPTFYTVASLLPVADTEDAIKLLGVAAQGLAILLVMVLAGHLVGPGPPEIAAGLLAAFFPPDLLELLRASYPALLGHAVDLGIVTVLACRWAALGTTHGAAFLAVGLGASALTYNAAPVHFAVFVPLLLAVASWPPALENRLRLLAAAAVGALLSLVFYGRYLRFTLEQALAGHAGAASPPAVMPRIERDLVLGDAASGLPYLVAALLGLALLLRRAWPRAEGRVVLAWALFPPAILLPVFLSPEPFRYFRTFYFAYPLYPLLAASLGGGRRLALTTFLLLGLSLWRLITLVPGFLLQ